jgi:hypothetical protein
MTIIYAPAHGNDFLKRKRRRRRRRPDQRDLHRFMWARRIAKSRLLPYECLMLLAYCRLLRALLGVLRKQFSWIAVRVVNNPDRPSKVWKLLIKQQ